MLDEKQRIWTCNKCNELLTKASGYLLDENDFDELIQMSNAIHKISKLNPDVKDAILVTMTYIEKMNNIMRRNDG